nr:hypothetical protein [Tanacetum cinerariifolium]
MCPYSPVPCGILDEFYCPGRTRTDHELTHIEAKITLKPLVKKHKDLINKLSLKLWISAKLGFQGVFGRTDSCPPGAVPTLGVLECNRPIFFDNNKDHYVQYKEYSKNSSNEIATSSSNQEKEGPPQDSDIRQLIREECCIEVCKEQKQNMEDAILELVEIYRQKELYCMHDNVDDLIESALDFKLLSINSQRLNKKKQEVKNIKEQSTKRITRIEKSLQNFRVIHKSSISLKSTSQISPVHAVAPILSTKEPEYSTSMGYEHPNATAKMESDEIIKSDVEELVPIITENEVTSEDQKDGNDDFEDIEYVEASLPNPEIVSVEEENVVYHEEEEVDLEDISQIQDVVLCEKFLSINRLIANIESLNDNPTPDRVLNSSVSFPTFEESNNSLSDNFLLEFKTFYDHTEETRNGNTTNHTDNSLPEYDSFCFEIESDQQRLINVVKNDISDDSTCDPLLEEADLFLASDNSIPPGIKNFVDDSERDIHAKFDFKLDAGEDISVVMKYSDEFDVSNDENDDYFSFMFLIYSKVFSFLLSAESEDTIFDPGISD